MYTGFLHLHNMLRWFVLIIALIVLIRSYYGWLGKAKWNKADNIFGIIFTASMDFQFLVGTVLYAFLSPITKAAFSNFGAAMQNTELRFYAVEHILMMVVALILVHIGRAKLKRATSGKKKFMMASVFYTLAIIIILAAIPWDRALV